MEQWLLQVLDAVETRDSMEVLTMMDYVDVLEEELVEGMEDSGENHQHEGENHDHGKQPDPHGSEDAYPESGDPDYDYVDHDGHETEIEYDEHIWTSPVNAMKITETIRDILVQMDSSHETLYRQNAEPDHPGGQVPLPLSGRGIPVGLPCCLFRVQHRYGAQCPDHRLSD